MVSLAAGLGAAGLLVNPYGLDYFRALRATSSETFAGIREWQPVWAAPAVQTEVVVGTAGLVVLAAAAWVANPGRRWAHLAWLVLLAAGYLSARRFAWMLNLTSLAVLAANAPVLDLRQWGKPNTHRRGKTAPAGEWRRVGWFGVGTVLVFAVIAAADGIASPPPGVEPVPAGVCDFVRDRDIPGRVFNDYENSGYLHWRFAGRPPLFIDLLNAYPDRVYRDYTEVVAGGPRGEALLDERGVGYVVLTTLRPGPSLKPLADLLDRSPKWVKVYADPEGHVWVRRTTEYEYLWRPVVDGARERGLPESGGR